jgi:hypothetical protein
VIVPWTIGGLLSDLAARGEHPAVISFDEDGIATWGGEVFAEKALSLARGLRENGIDKGSSVALGTKLAGLDRHSTRRISGGPNARADR